MKNRGIKIVKMTYHRKRKANFTSFHVQMENSSLNLVSFHKIEFWIVDLC